MLFRSMTVGAVGADLQRLNDRLAEHRALLSHVEKGDSDGFSAALRRHFESTHQVLMFS